MNKFLQGVLTFSAFLIFCAVVARVLYWIINEASGTGVALFTIVMGMLATLALGFWADIEKSKSLRREEQQ